MVMTKLMKESTDFIIIIIIILRDPIFFVVLTIGFLDSNTSMEIREDKGEISLPLGVILGTLQYTLSVDVETTAISASSM